MSDGTGAPTSIPLPPAGRDGFGWRVGVSIVTVFGLLGFILLFLALWAGPYSTLQTVVIILVAFLAFIGINGATWAGWGMRHAGWQRRP